VIDAARERHDDEGAEELADVVVHYAESARRQAQSTEDECRAVGEAVLGVLAAGDTETPDLDPASIASPVERWVDRSLGVP
jgi:hypothetical protein